MFFFLEELQDGGKGSKYPKRFYDREDQGTAT